MVPDLCALVRRDHDDLDRALVAMLDTETPRAELETLVDVFRLALAVHIAAETKILDALVMRLDPPPALRYVATQARREHVAQQESIDELLRWRPGTAKWYAAALELRVLVLDHAARAELTRWSLQDHVPPADQRALASDYATERMRVLATTSPLALAAARAHAVASGM